MGKSIIVHDRRLQGSAPIARGVTTIVVHSCGAADTQPENVGTNADGKYLMGALAMHTNATVYAGDRIQWYTGSTGTINFGSWEGTLWKFAPSGSFGPAPGNCVPLDSLHV